MSLELNNLRITKLTILQDRAHLFKKVREFFEKRSVLEVDCPALSRYTNISRHIDIFSVSDPGHPNRFLFSSPEHPMKRLLCQGIGDIYQMSHVFRLGEVGHLHNPEFTMVEWYRLKLNFQELISETLDFINLFLGDLEISKNTYHKLFQDHLGLCPSKNSLADFKNYAIKHNLSTPEYLKDWDKDTLLQFLMSFKIEPELGKDKLDVVFDYPATQASLSKIATSEYGNVAKRFEIYYKGVELANGYEELLDYSEQKSRFEQENQDRINDGKKALPLDILFIEDLKKGLPQCCGVAVGFDRLLMLRHNLQKISDVLPFSWNQN